MEVDIPLEKGNQSIKEQVEMNLCSDCPLATSTLYGCWQPMESACLWSVVWIRMFPIGSYIWTLCPQLVQLFLTGLGGVFLLDERHRWGLTLRISQVILVSFCLSPSCWPRCKLWETAPVPCLPAVILLPPWRSWMHYWELSSGWWQCHQGKCCSGLLVSNWIL